MTMWTTRTKSPGAGPGRAVRRLADAGSGRSCSADGVGRAVIADGDVSSPGNEVAWSGRETGCINGAP